MDTFERLDQLVAPEEWTLFLEWSMMECGSRKDRRWRQYHRWGKNRAMRGPSEQETGSLLQKYNLEQES